MAKVPLCQDIGKYGRIWSKKSANNSTSQHLKVNKMSQESPKSQESLNLAPRRATSKDLDSVLALNAKLFANDKKFDPTLDEEWVAKEGPEYFKGRIESPDGFVEVVEKDGQVVGYICGGLSEQDPIRKEGIYAEAENMLVDEQLRGKGVGSKLMDDFISWCKEKNVDKIKVVASFGNENTIEFYKKLGFKGYAVTLEIDLKKAE
jgi:GNAT superfamily N-acetyltransferase